MSSQTVARLGAQVPRVEVLPRRAMTSSGSEAAEFGELCGVYLDEWQRRVLDVSLGERRDGKWAAKTVDVLASRQNGKNAAIEIRELFGAVILGEGVLHTAHEFKTALKSHRRIRDLIAAHPDVAAEVVHKYASPATGYIFEFRSGGHIEFVARSNGSGRGFTDDLLVLDEAQALTDDHVGALMPALSARSFEGDPQVWYLGSAPGLDQVVWQRRRKAWRKGGLATQASFEFSAHPKADLDDRDAWAEGNPGYGRRISEEFIETERASMSDAMFAKERLSISDEIPDGDANVWESGVWAAACSPDAPKPIAGIVLALDVNPERSRSAIAVAGAAGICGLIDERPGTGWAIDETIRVAKANRATVAIASTGAAASMIPDLERAGVKVRSLSGADVAAACGWFFDAVAEQRVQIRTDQRLDEAVSVALKKNTGEKFVWARKGGDVCALVAVTLASWAACNNTAARPGVGGDVDQEAFDRELEQIIKDEADAMDELDS